MTADIALSLDLAVEDSRWMEVMPDYEALAGAAAAAAYAEAGFCESAGLSILLADDSRLQALNRVYRGKDKPTDVLSFPVAEETPLPAERMLGDIALAFETVTEAAKEQQRLLRDHFQHLIVHGSLHLIGYTHEAAPEADRMESLEIAALARLGVPNPYEGGDAAGDRMER